MAAPLVNLINLRNQFRKNDNPADIPGLKYFKIFFHFFNGDSDNPTNERMSNGLLSPIFDIDNISWTNDLYRTHTCAWTYLKLNDEETRAKNLVNFVHLLSNISSKSPWYFQTVDGVDTALERKNVNGKDIYKIEDEPQKITIKCLKDSVDDRIGSLIDLYRSVVYSYSTKRYVLPSNLRKFDMSILIFDPTINTSKYIDYENKTSYKYIEFHNCEIDYSSSKSGYTGLNNAEGNQVEYSIDISFDDVYENRFNEFLLESFGDFVRTDGMLEPTDTAAGELKSNTLENMIDQYDGSVSEHNEYVDPNKSKSKYSDWKDVDSSFTPGGTGVKTPYKATKSGFFSNLAKQLVGTAVNKGLNVLKSALLGNLYTMSITQGLTNMSQLAKGDVLGTYQVIKNAINNEKVRTGGEGGIGTLFETTFKQTGKKITSRIENIGDNYKMNAMQNNI